MPCRSDMHSNRDVFRRMHRDNTTSSTAKILHRRWRPLPNRVYMYSDHDLWRTLPHHDAQWWAGNTEMRSGGIAMPCRIDMHSNRDVFWSMHRDNTTFSTANIFPNTCFKCLGYWDDTGNNDFADNDKSCGSCANCIEWFRCGDK